MNRSAPPQINKDYAFLGCLWSALVVFITLAILASTTAYFPIDLIITRFLQSLKAPWFELLMQVVSWPGYAPQAIFIVLGIILFAWLEELKLETAFITGTAIGEQALNWLAKIAVRRPRPSQNLVEVFKKLANFSFPSGHVMFYTAFLGFLLYLSYRLLKPSWKRTILMILLAGLIILVGPSRVYLGEHWASDVLGGYILGGVWLGGMIRLYQIRKNKSIKEKSMLDTSTEFGKRAERRLKSEPVIWLTTVRKDNVPQPVPVWFLWEGESILIFTQPGTQKIRNLENISKASLHLDSDGRGSDIVVLEGEAQLLDRDLSATQVDAYIEKYKESIKSLGMTPEGFAQSYSVPIRFTPTRIRGH